MANGQITSGGGGDAVKQYVSSRGKITVTGRAVAGATVIVKVVDEIHGTNNPPMTGGVDWTQTLAASVGRHTLVVQIKVAGALEKDLTQEIEVVAG